MPASLSSPAVLSEYAPRLPLRHADFYIELKTAFPERPRYPFSERRNRVVLRREMPDVEHRHTEFERLERAVVFYVARDEQLRARGRRLADELGAAPAADRDPAYSPVGLAREPHAARLQLIPEPKHQLHDLPLGGQVAHPAEPVPLRPALRALERPHVPETQHVR